MLAISSFAEHAHNQAHLHHLHLVHHDPIACWMWNTCCLSFVLCRLDFTGGPPMHINSGLPSPTTLASATAMALRCLCTSHVICYLYNSGHGFLVVWAVWV
jgi:ammonia channel protein AmtB